MDEVCGEYLIELLDQELKTYRFCDLLKNDVFEQVKSEVNTYTLELNSNDLLHLWQSPNLEDINLSDLPHLDQFMKFLKSTVRRTVEQKYNITTEDKITATISKYKKGDFLLCHDDLAGTRSVAFVYYLNTLDEDDGGELRFFATSTMTRIPFCEAYSTKLTPTQNTLVTFEVSDISFHEVEQMYTDNERLTINGWFHIASNDDDVKCIEFFRKSDTVELLMSVKPILKGQQIVSGTFFSKNNMNSLTDAFKASAESCLLIDNALDKSFYRECLLQLEDSFEHYWSAKGPANFRNYETLSFEVEGPHIEFGECFFHINNLVDFLVSEDFLRILAAITGVEYVVFASKYVPPASMIEVQRWKQGSYSLLCDNDIERVQPTVEVTVFFGIKKNLISENYSDDGLMVRTQKYPVFTKADLDVKIELKTSRHLNHFLTKNWNKKIHKQDPSKMIQTKRTIAAIVEDKVKKMKQYRNAMNDITARLVIEDNNMLISMGSARDGKYVPYIRKLTRSSKNICFYAVSVTYFISK